MGWMAERNPTVIRVMLGFARLNPTYDGYDGMSFSAVCPSTR
jgi:hypothetical protein